MNCAIYNEIDTFAADWLTELAACDLIPSGSVDRRSIKELTGADCGPTTHFFAGIGGWPLALRLAGWPDDVPVWTGSCPCQPFSSAGKRGGVNDERHLWPDMFRLIDECRPAIIFAEQVASKDGLDWFDGVCNDLENAGYETGAADLCAPSVGAETLVKVGAAEPELRRAGPPHIRQRLFWVAIAEGTARQPNDRTVSSGERQGGQEVDNRLAGFGSDALPVGGIGDASEPRLQERTHGERRTFDLQRTAIERAGSWSDFDVVECLDGNSRRIGSGVFPLAHGIPSKRTDARMGYLLTRLGELGIDSKTASRMVREAKSNRVGRLRGYGNAIVPQVAALFVRAVMEWIGEGADGNS